MIKSILVVLAFITSYAYAGYSNTQIAVINKLYAYDDYGAITGKVGADIIVFTETGLSVCPNGVWLSPKAPGYQTLVTFLMTAHTTNKAIRFQVYDDRIWSGSAISKFCQIDAIRFES